MTEQTYSKPYPAAYVKALNAILALPSGPARWRVIAAVWVNTNYTQDDGLRAKEAYLQAVREVNDKRDHLHTDFAELKSTDSARDSGMREALEIPAGLWGWLKMFDMDAFGTPALIKKNMKRLREEFPEFCVAARY
jgi:hypothetical protein